MASMSLLHSMALEEMEKAIRVVSAQEARDKLLSIETVWLPYFYDLSHKTIYEHWYISCISVLKASGLNAELASTVVDRLTFIRTSNEYREMATSIHARLCCIANFSFERNILRPVITVCCKAATRNIPDRLEREIAATFVTNTTIRLPRYALQNGYSSPGLTLDDAVLLHLQSTVLAWSGTIRGYWKNDAANEAPYHEAVAALAAIVNSENIGNFIKYTHFPNYSSLNSLLTL